MYINQTFQGLLLHFLTTDHANDNERQSRSANGKPTLMPMERVQVVTATVKLMQYNEKEICPA